MNPTIVKYRERLGLQKPDGMPYFSVHRDDLAALLDAVEAASACGIRRMVSVRDHNAEKFDAALARLNGDKA